MPLTVLTDSPSVQLLSSTVQGCSAGLSGLMGRLHVYFSGHLEISSRQGVQQCDTWLPPADTTNPGRNFVRLVCGWWDYTCTLPALELALTSLVASLQSCKVEVNLTKSRIVVPNASELVHFPHLRSLHVTPIDYGFELSFWADLSQAPC